MCLHGDRDPRIQIALLIPAVPVADATTLATANLVSTPTTALLSVLYIPKEGKVFRDVGNFFRYGEALFPWDWSLIGKVTGASLQECALGLD